MIATSRSARGAREGSTLIELAVYTAILAVVGAPLSYLVQLTLGSASEQDASNRVAERSRVLVDRIVRDVRPSLKGTVQVPDPLRLAVTLPDRFENQVTVPGDRIEYVLTLSAGESQNGVDDNGNGLVDEGGLTRNNLTTGTSVTLAQDLDIGRSSFARNGDAVVVTLTTIGKSTRSTEVLSLSRVRTVFPRN